MSRLGFADRWIKLIMMCVKSTNYAVLVNGTPTGRIFPHEGNSPRGSTFTLSFSLMCRGSQLFTDESGTY